MTKDQLLTLSDIFDKVEREEISNFKLLVELIAWLREGGIDGSAHRLRLLTMELQKKSLYTDILTEAMDQVFSRYSFLRLFTESGLADSDSFFYQFKNRLWNRILPMVYDDNDAVDLINRLFSHKDDWKWVYAIPDADLQAFLAQVNIREIFQLPRNSKIVFQLLNSIQILSLRITLLGIKREILEKLPELEEFDSPFYGTKL